MASPKEKKKRLDFNEFQNGSHFKGILKLKNPLHIGGNFEGEILSDSYINISTSSVINAHITAKEIESSGEVHGNMTALERISLLSGSKLIGNIKTPSLEMEDGVIFDGQSEMLVNDATENGEKKS